MAEAPPRKRLAILVGGGPAPGINSVIGAATIEAVNSGLDVVGIYDGFKWLSADDFTPGRNPTDRTIPVVKRTHFAGGSILRTARRSLLNSDHLRLSTVVMPDDQKIARVIENLRKIGVQYLITIGGDDTALSARLVSERSEGAIRVVH